VLEFCVLALLRDGERDSVDLVRARGDADGLVTSERTLYPLLGRLRREGKCISTAYSRDAAATTHSNVTTHCSGGAGTGVVVLLIVIVAVLVIAPVVSAVYLARRAA
jgi:hypothetical protein